MPGLSENVVTRLTVRAASVQTKIEVTPVLRGKVYPTELRVVSPAVENAFGFAEINVVSFADLYAGKIVAALDRQHPRDLFDVRDLFANEGIDDDLRRAFVVYLLSHGRPMFEVLKAVPKDIGPEFLRGFEGMTDVPIALDELTATRTRLAIVGEMPSTHRRFWFLLKRDVPIGRFSTFRARRNCRQSAGDSRTSTASRQTGGQRWLLGLRTF